MQVSSTKIAAFNDCKYRYYRQYVLGEAADTPPPEAFKRGNDWEIEVIAVLALYIEHGVVLDGWNYKAFYDMVEYLGSRGIIGRPFKKQHKIEYPVGEDQFLGYADIVFFLNDEGEPPRVAIIDIKSSMYADLYKGSHNYYQVAWYGLKWELEHPGSVDFIGILARREWARMQGNIVDWQDAWDKLLVETEKIKQWEASHAAGEIRGIEPTVGGHCRYCPFQRSCPYNLAYREEHGDAEDIRAFMEDTVKSFVATSEWANRTRRIVVDYIEQNGPIDLGDVVIDVERGVRTQLDDGFIDEIIKIIAGETGVPVDTVETVIRAAQRKGFYPSTRRINELASEYPNLLPYIHQFLGYPKLVYKKKKEDSNG